MFRVTNSTGTNFVSDGNALLIPQKDLVERSDSPVGLNEWSENKPPLNSMSSSFVLPSRRISKPILKKRSNSEMMLARHNIASEESDSLTNSDTIMATDSTKLVRPQASRTHSANSVLRSARKQHFRKETGGDIPKRHIHFNESVEQCISIIKPDPEDDEYASDSSDDAPTMRISAPKLPINIAKLPSTTLKLPSPISAAIQQNLLSSDELDDFSDEDIHHHNDEHNFRFRTSSSGAATTRSSRSNSGDSTILPNYDGNHGDSPPAGIFGRAAEVVYSARDLVSVMWSASSGWRRADPSQTH